MALRDEGVGGHSGEPSVTGWGAGGQADSDEVRRKTAAAVQDGGQTRAGRHVASTIAKNTEDARRSE